MKSTYEQILHLLNLDLTPVCKGAFCCPLHSHASVFSVSEQTGTSRALDGKIPFRTSQMRDLWNGTFVDNYERSNYLKNFRHVYLAMIRPLV